MEHMEDTEIDSVFIKKLLALGKANKFKEYLDLLHKGLSKVTVQESNEPMLSLKNHLHKKIVIDLAKLPIELSEKEQHSRLYLRRSVIEKLNRVQEKLPDGLRLMIRDPFRSKDVVTKLYGAYMKRVMKERGLDKHAADLYVRNILALPDDPVTPGHMTGGAVDVVLALPDGSRAPMTVDTKIIPWERQMLTDCPGLPDEALRYRRLLKSAMRQEGFHNYFREYWHYSWGDAYFAVRRKKKVACYGIPPPKLFVK